MSDKWKDLAAPMPYKWRVQSFSKNKPQASCVAYVDARDVMDRLDDVIGPENWRDEYREIHGMLFCGLSVKIADEWITKWDTGSESNIEKEKGHVSDSFKRAAVKFGVGRFLYGLDIKYVAANEKKTSNNFPYVVDENGKRVWDLTEYLNRSENGRAQQPQKPSRAAKPEQATATSTDKYDEWIAKQEQWRKISDECPRAGIELTTWLNQFGTLSPDCDKLLSQDKRTADEQKRIIPALLDYASNGNAATAAIALKIATIFKGKDGYVLVDSWEKFGKIDKDKRISMIYRAAKGAAISAAMREEEEVQRKSA